MLDASLVISEFMAINDDTLETRIRTSVAHPWEDPIAPDWIEIHNPGAAEADLAGWKLRGDAETWTFPANTPIASGGYLLVMASNENITDPALDINGYLHTNFKLSGDGEYLALLRPDDSVAHAFAPAYPEQVEDVSYGTGGTTLVGDLLVSDTAPVEVLIPTDNTLGTTWTGGNEPFNEPGWIEGFAGVGYDTANGGAALDVKINFQPSGSSVPAGYLPDSGAIFANRGNGFSYGWNATTDETRDRNANGDQRYDTLNHLEKAAPRTWEIEVPNGTYDVLLVCGDPSNIDQINTMDVEGTILTDPDGGDNFDEYSPSVTVSDGRLTVKPASGSSNSKICFIDITSVGEPSYDLFIGTDVQAAMYQQTTSAYIRQSFPVVDPASYDSLSLNVRYDDGFVAYLNGVKIAEDNAPASPAYNSVATAKHDDALAVIPRQFDATPYLQHLQTGENVLAIHGLNHTADSTDFLMQARLLGNQTTTFGEQYYAAPTPEAANSEGALGLVADTRFSVDRGFKDAAFDVVLTTTTPDAEIRYTTDGSWPSETVGTVYSGSITISSTTALRAIAWKPGYLSTNVDTQTYLFLDDVIRKTGAGLPTVWGTTSSPDYAMDQEVVNDNIATIYDDLKAIPTVSLVTDIDNWFAPHPVGIYPVSKSMPTAVSMEFFTADGSEEFQIDGSAQIQGGGPYGTSADRWKSYKLSLRLKFTEEFGDPKLRFPIFGEDAADWFDTLILDAQLNHTWLHPSDDQRTTARYIQDQVMGDMQNALG